jgi:hypothetical protein
MRRNPILVIPRGARNLALSATEKNKISRLRLEMTIAKQIPRRGRIEVRLERFERFERLELLVEEQRKPA